VGVFCELFHYFSRIRASPHQYSSTSPELMHSLPGFLHTLTITIPHASPTLLFHPMQSSVVVLCSLLTCSSILCHAVCRTQVRKWEICFWKMECIYYTTHMRVHLVWGRCFAQRDLYFTYLFQKIFLYLHTICICPAITCQQTEYKGAGDRVSG
jgi:hypothetical protein